MCLFEDTRSEPPPPKFANPKTGFKNNGTTEKLPEVLHLDSGFLDSGREKTKTKAKAKTEKTKMETETKVTTKTKNENEHENVDENELILRYRSQSEW